MEDSLSPPVADTSRSMKEIDYRPSKTLQEGAVCDCVVNVLFEFNVRYQVVCEMV